MLKELKIILIIIYQAVIDADLIPEAIATYDTANLKLRNEIAWIVANITSTGDRKQIDYVVENGGIELLLKHLKIDDKAKARVALEGLENILKCYDGEDENESVSVSVKKIEELNGIF